MTTVTSRSGSSRPSSWLVNPRNRAEVSGCGTSLRQLGPARQPGQTNDPRSATDPGVLLLSLISREEGGDERDDCRPHRQHDPEQRQDGERHYGVHGNLVPFSRCAACSVPATAGTECNAARDQGCSAMASPVTMARATGEGSDPSSTNPSRTCTAGWAIIRGPRPRCGQVAVCAANGCHKKTSPAWPVACATGLHSTDGRQNSAPALVPASPYGARNCGTCRCDPHTSRVGASSGPTSVNSSNASSPRARDRTFTQYPPGPS